VAARLLAGGSSPYSAAASPCGARVVGPKIPGDVPLQTARRQLRSLSGQRFGAALPSRAQPQFRICAALMPLTVFGQRNRVLRNYRESWLNSFRDQHPGATLLAVRPWALPACSENPRLASRLTMIERIGWPAAEIIRPARSGESLFNSSWAMVGAACLRCLGWVLCVLGRSPMESTWCRPVRCQFARQRWPRGRPTTVRGSWTDAPPFFQRSSVRRRLGPRACKPQWPRPGAAKPVPRVKTLMLGHRHGFPARWRPE